MAALSKARKQAKQRKAAAKPSALSTTEKVTVGLATAGVGMALGGSPLGLLAAVLAPSLTHMVEQGHYLYAKRGVGHVVESVQEELELDDAGLVEALQTAGPDLIPLTVEVLQAASTTTAEWKLDGLARIWAHGIRDPSKLYEEVMMTRVLMQLEEPHLRILAGFQHGEYASADEPTIWKRLPDLFMVLPMTLQTLSQLGLIAPGQGVFSPGIPYWHMTPWGFRAKERLDMAATAVVEETNAAEQQEAPDGSLRSGSD